MPEERLKPGPTPAPPPYLLLGLGLHSLPPAGNREMGVAPVQPQPHQQHAAPEQPCGASPTPPLVSFQLANSKEMGELSEQSRVRTSIPAVYTPYSQTCQSHHTSIPGFQEHPFYQGSRPSSPREAAAQGRRSPSHRQRSQEDKDKEPESVNRAISLEEWAGRSD